MAELDEGLEPPEGFPNNNVFELAVHIGNLFYTFLPEQRIIDVIEDKEDLVSR
jgi:hypothetical protein